MLHNLSYLEPKVIKILAKKRQHTLNALSDAEYLITTIYLCNDSGDMNVSRRTCVD